MAAFLHQLMLEARAIARAHVAALGGNGASLIAWMATALDLLAHDSTPSLPHRRVRACVRAALLSFRVSSRESVSRMHSSHMYNMISVAGDAAHVESDEFFGTGMPWAPSMAAGTERDHSHLEVGAEEEGVSGAAAREWRLAVMARESLAQELVP